jgi:type IV pilus assembly protein PilM
LFSRDKTSVGLDIGASSVKVVEVEMHGDEARIVHVGEAPLEPDVIVDGEIMDRQMLVAAIRDLFETHRIEARRVILGLHGRGVIVKKILVDRVDPAQADEAVFGEAEQHVAYDVDDLSLDYQILDLERGPKMQVLLVAAKRDLVLSRVEIIREAGLAVDAVDVNCFALQNALERSESLGSEETVALLNVGADITNVNVVRGGVPLYTQDLPLGSHSYLQAVQKAFRLSRAEAEKALQEKPCRLDVQPLIEQFCADLSSSLEKSLNYLRTSGEADHLDRVLVCGGGGQIEGVVELLARRQSVPVTLADPLRGVACSRGVFPDGGPGSIAPRLAVGLGLALRKERPK